MKEPVKEGRDQGVHSIDFVAGVRESLKLAATNEERIDVLARAKKHADSQWFYWKDVREYIDNQLAVVEYEAQLKLPL